MRRWVILLGLLLAMHTPPAWASPSEPAALQLVDVGRVDPAMIAVRDAKLSRDGTALHVASGHTELFPGITINAPLGQWNLSRFALLAVELKNVGNEELTLCCRVDTPGGDGASQSITAALILRPGETGELRVALPRPRSNIVPQPGKMLFGMRGYPAEFGTEVVDPADLPKAMFDPRAVSAVLVFVNRPMADGAFEISGIRAEGIAMPPRLSADQLFPLIDAYGQYIHRDWPGKTHSPAELQAFAAQEMRDLHDHPGPPDWDRYGGYNAGPTLAKTGFFRTEKYRGKWWLVDPEGKLFFSNGIDCIGNLGQTGIEDRDNWFADFPGTQPAFREFLSQANSFKGDYAGHTVQTFSFAAANLKRRFGDNWRTASGQLAQQRLRSWGLNTIGNWSSPDICYLHKTPYVMALSAGPLRPIAGSYGYWGKFVDPFDPQFATHLTHNIAAQGARAINDPWCIGFFVGNELSWATWSRDQTSLAVATLRSPADQPAKLAFVADLKSKYGDIAALNQAWGTSHASWDALLASQDAPTLQVAEPDLAAFYSRIAEQYFSVVRTAIKTAAPHQLYLGCRFASNCPRARAAAVKYCDVVSFNFYATSEAAFRLPEGDVPVLIGEFHFGALDRGLFHPGLVPVASQQARADAYRHFVRGVLSNPCFVGCHWFQYQDEPTIGRVYDGENYQIGFVDVVNNPYPETIQACRDVGYSVYATRMSP